MRSFIWIIMFSAIAACSWDTAPTVQSSPKTAVTKVRSAPPAVPTTVRQATQLDSVAWVAATIAQEQMGVPYQYGGATPGGFDCSGLVFYAYDQAGVRVPRTTGSLWSHAQPVARHQLQPGDVLFFNFDGKPSHVGLYLGDDYFVHAPSTGRQVSRASLKSPFYAERLIRGGRLIH
ncbi:MAG: C40 family peptidase [Woeseiaceae bacterium]